MSEYRLIERFKSRKNRVYKVIFDGKEGVLKIFSSISRMEREYSVLNSLEGKLNIPEVYDIDEKRRFILMEFVDGKNLCDFVNSDGKEDEKLKIMNDLASWFYEFHSLTGKLRGDSILRNFILSSNGIYGLDFEESREGNVEEDIAEICISILTTYPIFTDLKFDLCRNFVNSYSELLKLDIQKLKNSLLETLDRISKRRESEDLKICGIEKMKSNGLI